ncbi:lipopolysaccharide biosynthesis protein [Nordella sp. HKS 07]|uniref:GumC family protein n=1 Tax=Nordella sp. HKS 07 TaxID=2712222 RepID=UPI0013E171FD|nr:lipopolysaccharide biosynthesis protein [Nordella sp. HKS 07]QIG51845.1 lipopolysaccharide biosynthesis protein [Nordella sp. HKS 07]
MSSSDLRFYWSLMWRRVHYVMGITLLVSIVGIVFAWSLPPVYRATSRLIIETAQMPEQLARSTVSVSGIEQMQIIEQKIMTNENLLNLARKFNVYESKNGHLESDIVEDMAARVIFAQIRLEVPPNSALAGFSISFEAEEPGVAADVAQAITTQILDENTKRRVDSADDTLRFFEGSVKNLDGELNLLEGELLTFKKANKDALPDSLAYRRNEQARQQERLAQLEREEASLRDRRSGLVRIYDGTEAVVGINQSLTPEGEMLQQLRRTLAEKQGIYADENPNMSALRSQIEHLEETVASQRAGRKNAVGNKRYSELDIQLAEIDARLTSIKQERSDIAAVLKDLKQTILATPENEIVLTSLERRHKNIQTQYDSAIARLAEATTGKQIEQRFKGERISIIEMATPPDKPVPSKRLKIAAGAVAVGIILGFGFVLLLELLNRTIRRPTDLVNYLEIRPFATIQYIASRSEVIARRLAVGTILFAALMVPLSAFVIYYQFEPIGSFVEGIFSRMAQASHEQNG